MFAAPPEHTLEWNDDAVLGANRFLRRLWALVRRHQTAVARLNAGRRGNGGFDWTGSHPDPEVRALRAATHAALERINRDYQRYQFNTVVAACMELLNAIDRFDVPQAAGDGDEARVAAVLEALAVLVAVLAPIVPHVAHVLWGALGQVDDVIDARWPEVDMPGPLSAILWRWSCR